MEMDKYICWNPSAVYQVIKIDAEAVGDKVFQAVHSPQPILMSTTSPDNLAKGTDRDFLRAFTNPDVPEIFSLMLGDSGMGKTHFIHWLRLNVPEDKKTRVVNIPKVGTSLRSIVERIITQLPVEMQGQYLSKLTTMGRETHTQEQLQEKLLDSLAQAVSAEASRDSVQDMMHREILKGLAALFRDPHIRAQWFLASGREGIIKELTRHVYERNEEYNRRERDRRFVAADFQIQGVQHGNVSLEARNMLLYFRADSSSLETAANLTNQCLDTAIGEALSFSSEDLVALVAEVRTNLHEQGLTLILYIEDLSRMQGVDKALLDALTTPSNQGDQKLCPIRWIAAMTTGYFDRLEVTITTRINLIGKVEADQKDWENPQQAQDELAAFTGRYLNAARLGMDRLNAWDPADDVPNACDTCERRDCCHDAFGTGAGFGLYPYTTVGLLNMAERSAPPNEFWFKPRRLLKSIVTPMLFVHGREIVEGRFPPLAMLEELGGERLDALEKVELYRIAGDEADRHLVLQELWQPSPKIVRFSESLLQAFTLRPLQGRAHTDSAVTPSLPLRATTSGANRVIVPLASSGADTAPAFTSPAPVSLPPGSSASLPPSTVAADPILHKLRDWGNRKPMDDNVLNAVRPIVFEAIVNHIDWDRSGVSRTPYVGASPRPFTRMSVVFRGQITKPRAQLYLYLPSNDDDHSYARAATALQGLYLFNKHGHWNFEDGYRYLAHSQSCLEEWARAALGLVRSVAPNNEKWNALDAATELLAVGTALSGNISVGSARDDLWSGIWGKVPAIAPERLFSSELQRIANDITSKWDKLQEHVKARSSGTKGSQTGNFLNPGERERVLNRLVRNHWKLSMTPDQDQDEKMYRDFKEIAVLYQKVSQSLQAALEAEAEAYRAWLAKMDESFGADMVNRADLFGVFEELQLALNNGAFLKREADQFQQRLDAFASATYGDARKRAGMVAGTEAGKLVPYLFAKRNVAHAMRTANSLADATEQFLEDVSAFHANRMDELEAVDGDGLQECWAEIGNTLSLLDATLERLGSDEGVGRQEA